MITFQQYEPDCREEVDRLTQELRHGRLAIAELLEMRKVLAVIIANSGGSVFIGDSAHAMSDGTFEAARDECRRGVVLTVKQ